MSQLTINTLPHEPSSITFTPVQPARITGGVHVAAPFAVQRDDGTLLHGAADDYLVIDAGGELVPVPRAIGLLLFKPFIEVKHERE